VPAALQAISEFFTLRTAERTIRGYTPAKHLRLRAHFEAAERRLAAARRVPHAIPAAVLFHGAVSHYLRAIEALRDVDESEHTAGARDLWAAQLHAVPEDPTRPMAIPTDDERVRAALATHDPLYFDQLSPEDAEKARWALERAACMLRRRVEPRSLANVRGARWGRAIGLAVIVAYVAVAGIRARLLPRNIALGRPVHPSSLMMNPPDGHELVDGEIGSSYGVATNVQDSPFVVIDLEDVYLLDRVNVHNRADTAFDDCLPLVVELSTDGTSYAEIARREEHFDANPPWVVDGHQQPARYVRLRVARHSYLALSEVEVFGKTLSKKPPAR
jgi:hypothetical protein